MTADDPRLTAAGLLFEATAGLSARLEVQLDEHSFSTTDFDVLLRLARSPERRLRMSDLAAQVPMTQSGPPRLVDRLDPAGLVERAQCPTDRRGAFAVLTEDVHARLTEVLPGHLRLVVDWFTGVYTAAELEVLLRSLRRLRDHVRPDATAGAGPGPQ